MCDKVIIENGETLILLQNQEMCNKEVDNLFLNDIRLKT